MNQKVLGELRIDARKYEEELNNLLENLQMSISCSDHEAVDILVESGALHLLRKGQVKSSREVLKDVIYQLKRKKTEAKKDYEEKMIMAKVIKGKR